MDNLARKIKGHEFKLVAKNHVLEIWGRFVRTFVTILLIELIPFLFLVAKLVEK